MVCFLRSAFTTQMLSSTCLSVGARFIAVKREEGWGFLLVHELWKSLNKMIGQEHWFLTDAMVRFCFQEAKYLRVLSWINHPEHGGYLCTIYSTTPSYSDRQGAAAMDQRFTVWGTVQLWFKPKIKLVSATNFEFWEKFCDKPWTLT